MLACVLYYPEHSPSSQRVKKEPSEDWNSFKLVLYEICKNSADIFRQEVTMPYMLIWINLATFFLGIKKRDKTWNQGKNA